jgi:hypothetical protein
LRAALPPPPRPFDETKASLEAAATREAATDAAMPFLVDRFETVLVLAIRGRSAIGYRGHGVPIGDVGTISISLDESSTVQRALDVRRTSILAGASATQDELARRMNTPTPSAAPVLVGGTAIAVIVVGDPIHGFGETERSLLDLNRVTSALADAYGRIAGR